jgi:hypothetical protein
VMNMQTPYCRSHFSVLASPFVFRFGAMRRSNRT